MRSHGVRHDWSDLAAAAGALFCYQLHSYTVSLASLVAQIVKNLPAMQETRVQSLGWEDAGEGNGNPLQYSCLDNSMDRGTWWATVYAIPKNRAKRCIHIRRSKFQFNLTTLNSVSVCLILILENCLLKLFCIISSIFIVYWFIISYSFHFIHLFFLTELHFHFIHSCCCCCC